MSTREASAGVSEPSKKKIHRLCGWHARTSRRSPDRADVRLLSEGEEWRRVAQIEKWLGRQLGRSIARRVQAGQCCRVHTSVHRRPGGPLLHGFAARWGQSARVRPQGRQQPVQRGSLAGHIERVAPQEHVPGCAGQRQAVVRMVHCFLFGRQPGRRRVSNPCQERPEHRPAELRHGEPVRCPGRAWGVSPDTRAVTEPPTEDNRSTQRTKSVCVGALSSGYW